MSVDLNSAFRIKLNDVMLSIVFLTIEEVASYLEKLQEKIENNCDVVVLQGDKEIITKTLYVSDGEEEEEVFENDDDEDPKELLRKINKLITEFLENN